MEKIITYENLKSFAYVNDGICVQPVKGIVVSFFGLGGMSMFDDETDEGKMYAQKGILYVVPYNNPWAWMNKQAVAYTDEIIDVLFEKYSLADDTSIVSTGRSMGGLSALVYTHYSKRTPVSCIANCPVCDAVYHYTERKDLPRTLYSALFNEEGTLENALESISPLHLVSVMPKIKYHIFHCSKDTRVNINAHSEKLVFELEKHGFNYTYDVVDGKDHCDLTPEMAEKFVEYSVRDIFEK